MGRMARLEWLHGRPPTLSVVGGSCPLMEQAPGAISGGHGMLEEVTAHSAWSFLSVQHRVGGLSPCDQSEKPGGLQHRGFLVLITVIHSVLHNFVLFTVTVPIKVP